MNQNYFLVNDESGVVYNSIVWDGNTQTWPLPEGVTALVAAETPAMVWRYDQEAEDCVLVEIIGAGGIGFSWDGSVLKTNSPKPVSFANPTISNAQY